MQTETEVKDVEREELLSWLGDKVTRAYLASLNETTKQLMLDNARGGALNTESMESTALQYAKTCGVIEGLLMAMNIEVSEDAESSGRSGSN